MIHETFNPGAVVAIDARDTESGKQSRIWEGDDPGGQAPVFVEFEVKGTVAKEITILLDTARVAGWNEIDAVKIVGQLVPGALVDR